MKNKQIAKFKKSFIFYFLEMEKSTTLQTCDSLRTLVCCLSPINPQILSLHDDTAYRNGLLKMIHDVPFGNNPFIGKVIQGVLQGLELCFQELRLGGTPPRTTRPGSKHQAGLQTLTSFRKRHFQDFCLENSFWTVD